MHSATELEYAVDELCELSLTRNAGRASNLLPRHFAALIAELCAQLVLMSGQQGRVEFATHIRRDFAARE